MRLRSEARLRPCKDIRLRRAIYAQDIRPCGSMIWRPGGTPCGVASRRISNISEIKVAGFYEKPAIFVSLRGAQRRGNLKAKGMASRGEARERETKRNPYHKKQEICCIVSRHLSLFQGSVSFRPTIVRSGMPFRSVSDCRVVRKNAPSSQ